MRRGPGGGAGGVGEGGGVLGHIQRLNTRQGGQGTAAEVVLGRAEKERFRV